MPLKTNYELALHEAMQLTHSSWAIGESLMLAIDEEGRSIREFCMDLWGNYDKEDTYGRFVQANRFKVLTKGIPASHQFEGLEITWYAEAWKAVEDSMDIEDVLECLVKGKRGEMNINQFRGKRAEAVGKTAPLEKRLRRASNQLEKAYKEIEKLQPELSGLTLSMDSYAGNQAAYFLNLWWKETRLSVIEAADVLRWIADAEKEDKEGWSIP